MNIYAWAGLAIVLGLVLIAILKLFKDMKDRFGDSTNHIFKN